VMVVLLTKHQTALDLEHVMYQLKLYIMARRFVLILFRTGLSGLQQAPIKTKKSRS